MQQHTPGSPQQARVRGSRVSFPVIHIDRLRAAKALVAKAVKEKKVFSVQGPYPVIRAALRARGWVERRMPRRSTQSHHHGDRDAEVTEETDSSNDDGDGLSDRGDREYDPDDTYSLMSRLLHNELTYFYWTTKSDALDHMSLHKDQMINHYAKAGSFTTKVGLCMNLRNLKWFDSTDPDTFFPRCYRLGAEDDKQAFTDDFRRTACTSLLRYVVERAGGQEEGDIYHVKQPQGLDKRHKPQAKQRIGVGLIETALRVSQEYLNSLEHCDIDIALETPPTLSEQQWANFIHSYYLVIHDGVVLEGCSEYSERCQSMLERMRKVCSQLEIDGVNNIWIIKPGAKSRGRGIVCMNRLDEILGLVNSDSALIKDSKWVVQKYVERPLLIHGTKFDLRQWFLVTDWNPLTVWFYRDSYLRFSTQLYSTHRLDSSVHLCNNSIQKYFQPSAGRDPSLPAESMWSSAEFRSWLAASGRGGLWEDVVLPGMRRALIQTLLTAQDSVEPRKASFELYGADFLLGCDLQPWLLEVNVSPTMACSTAVTARLCPAVQEDTLRVVLDRRYDRNTDTGGFQLIYKQAPVEVPQYLGVSFLVEGAQIRRPRSSRPKTFIRSHYESLHKSRRVLQAHTRPSDKENQREEEKRICPAPVCTRKVTTERRVTLQPLMEKRRLRTDALPPSSGPLPNPSDRHRLHTSHTRTHHTHARAEPTHAHTHRTQRHALSLNRLEPSLEIITLQPGISYKGFYQQNTHTHTPLTHTVQVSHPVIRLHQNFSLLQRQNTETYRNKGHAAPRDCTRQREK
ncbi:tubulin monoglycylase TTLL3 isoform X1 [Ictalurus punctatus]|uniref:Tubulin monoglycylase TTLL3 isoform X1 n=1 Tax=Ictalurus punctatus TaxID=7998 RepID=A0A2D0RX62_ICTPU|nr:tubulin monoglycylase TTLL3 isoform X1 [Ictalurus punctatus]XP_017335089.1 tubulin monoglycylase TTLL3 isoform X1 [Ictalurus punctatus]